MILVNCRQGDETWRNARAGIPTASKFGVLMTAEARKGKLTKGAATYMYHLLAEWLLGQPLDDGAPGGFVSRGTEMEAEAVAWYSLIKGVEVERSGFITDDAGTVGCSLDGMVASDGTVEAKCYALTHHIAALLEPDGEHLPQMMGGLWITGRDWCDRILYHPSLPPSVIRFERDDEYIAALAQSVARFQEHMASAKERLLAMGCKPKHPSAGIPREELDEFDSLVAEGV